jgi:hypothetical protein
MAALAALTATRTSANRCLTAWKRPDWTAKLLPLQDVHDGIGEHLLREPDQLGGQGTPSGRQSVRPDIGGADHVPGRRGQLAGGLAEPEGGVGTANRPELEARRGDGDQTVRVGDDKGSGPLVAGQHDSVDPHPARRLHNGVCRALQQWWEDECRGFIEGKMSAVQEHEIERGGNGERPALFLGQHPDSGSWLSVE